MKENEKLADCILDAWERVRTVGPLVHHITNYVTVNDCANITLAAGASPIMADDESEVEEIEAIASVLVLNIGTLNSRTVSSALAAGRAAASRGVPAVLDPVGAGVSSLRNGAVKSILTAFPVSIIRGNMSEMSWVAGLETAARGVDVSVEDALSGPEKAREVARTVALHHGCTAAVTGPVDVVSDGTRAAFISNGTPLLSLVTGTGCMCTSLVASFRGSGDDAFIAAAGALAVMGVAGELAEENVSGRGTGSFRTALIDAVSTLDRGTLARRMRVSTSSYLKEAHGAVK